MGKMLTRREFLRRGAIGTGMLAFPDALLRAGVGVAAPAFAKVPRFSVPLPIPARASAVAANTYHITQRQTQQTLHPRLGQTTVWGYDDGTLGPLYPGPTIEVLQRAPTTATLTTRSSRTSTGRVKPRPSPTRTSSRRRRSGTTTTQSRSRG